MKTFNFQIERSEQEVILRGTFSSSELIALLQLYEDLGYDLVVHYEEDKGWRLIKSEAAE